MLEAQEDQPHVSLDEITGNLIELIPEGTVTLTAIHPEAGVKGSRTFDLPAEAQSAAEWAVARNYQQQNIYFGANVSRAENTRSQEADISHARFLWADIDPDVKQAGGYGAARETLERDIMPNVAPHASLLIDSGNGFQALFRLSKQRAIDSPEALAAYKELNRQVGYHFRGGGTQNADRILRLPGTLNYPNPAKLRKGYPQKPVKSRLMASREVTYSPAKLAAMVRDSDASTSVALEAPEALTARFRAFLGQNSVAQKRYNGDSKGLTDTSGSGRDMSMFAYMKRAGFTKDEIAGLLDTWSHGSQNGRLQGARYWDRLDQRTDQPPPKAAGSIFASVVPVGIKGITAQELAGKEFPPLNWVVPGILPEGCYLLTARPKVGKSWLGLQVSLAVALGLPTLGQQACKGKAVYLALEDNQRRLQDRLQQLRPQGYATPDLILHTSWPRFDAGGLEALKALIEQDHPKLIVIDTLAKVRPSTTGSNVYENDYKALAPLTELANQHRCCIVVVHHNRKGKADGDALEQISGSLGLAGAVDGALVIDGVRSDKQYKLSLIGRDIPTDDELAISRKSNGEWEVLGVAQQVFISAERKQIADLLSLHPQGLKPREIADNLGKGGPATRKLLMSMATDQQVKVTHGVYSLPTLTGNSSSGGVGGNTGNSGYA